MKDRAGWAAAAFAAAVFTAACGGGDGATPLAADTDATTTTVTSTTTTTAPTTTTTTLPDEQAVVLCAPREVEFIHVGLSTGEVRHRTGPHPVGTAELPGVWLDGSPGIGSICQSPPRTQFDDDYTSVVGVGSYTDGSQVPIIADLATMEARRAVDPGPVADFGPARPETLVAGFTPDGLGLFWRERGEGPCRSYLVSELPSSRPISRDQVEGYLVGEGGSCYNLDMVVRWHAGTPYVCSGSFACDDPNGTEIEGVRSDDLEDNDDLYVWQGELPASERFSLTTGYRVADTGLVYFGGQDDTGQYLFAWAGGDSQPEQIAALPDAPSSWVVVGFRSTVTD